MNSAAYAEMAANLAASLRTALGEVNIAVICDAVTAPIVRVTCPGVEIRMAQQANPFTEKCRLFEHFQEAIFIDADSIVANTSLLQSALPFLQSTDLYLHTIDTISTGQDHPLAWDTYDHLAKAYKLKRPFPVYNSSLIAYGKKSKAWWKKVGDIASKPISLRSDMAGAFPDEVPMGVASSKIGRYADGGPDNLLWFHWSKARTTDNAIMTMAGRGQSGSAISDYNALATRARGKWAYKFRPNAKWNSR